MTMVLEIMGEWAHLSGSTTPFLSPYHCPLVYSLSLSLFFFLFSLLSLGRIRSLFLVVVVVLLLTMVQITEFRVVMPLSLEEYRVAQMYMVIKMQQQNTFNNEGVEVLQNRPFENDELGKGQYTYKIYHIHSKFPKWLAAIAPVDSLLIEEEAWNAFPKCKTVLKCPYFARFKITVETVHLADNGLSPNVHNLDANALAIRNVEVPDITSNTRDYWSYMLCGSMVDLTSFKSKKTNRGPLKAGWQESANPMMTAYKLVTVDAPYWGFGYRMEQAVLGAERALFMESHKCCFSWIDDWFGLTMDDLRRMEEESIARLNKALHKNGSVEGGSANEDEEEDEDEDGDEDEDEAKSGPKEKLSDSDAKVVRESSDPIASLCYINANTPNGLVIKS